MSDQPDQPSAKKPSISDVARLAGVSQTTVSFVFNDVQYANISQETKERVWSAIKELNWRPNVMSRGLTSRQTHTIGLLSDRILTTPHAGKIIQGAQDAAWANDKMLLVINTDRNPKIERAAIESFVERQIDGIIYATMFHYEVDLPSFPPNVPVVLLDCYTRNRSLPSVVPDEVQGGRAATKALLDKGHRRVAFINNIDPITAQCTRLEGYKQALDAFDVPFDAELVKYGRTTHTSGGYNCTLELLQLPDPPTAIFCFNDVVAMGTYDALRKQGMKIPDDVAVIGFDNMEMIAAQLHPALSTMELPHYEMGQWALHYLLEHPNNHGNGEPIQHKIACPFISRASI